METRSRRLARATLVGRELLAGAGAGGDEAGAGWRRVLVGYVPDDDLCAFSLTCTAMAGAAAGGERAVRPPSATPRPEARPGRVGAVERLGMARQRVRGGRGGRSPGGVAAGAVGRLRVELADLQGGG